MDSFFICHLESPRNEFGTDEVPTCRRPDEGQRPTPRKGGRGARWRWSLCGL